MSSSAGRDPDYLDFIRRRFKAPAGPPAETVEELRREHSADLALVPRPPVGHVRDLNLEGPAGPLHARLYRPAAAHAPPPVLVYFHGGGWALGDVDGYDPVVRALTVACGTAFVSVSYRRPPEHPYPAAVDDAAAAIAQVSRQAADLGVDPGRVGVAGDSAGGQIAAAAARRTGPGLALQLLVYPVVDLREVPPQPPDPDGLGRGQASVAGLERVAQWYLGGTDRALPEVSPGLAPDLTGAPPTIIATAEYDRLAAQGEVYAARLAEAGVATTLIRGTGLDHGFLGWGCFARRPAEVIAEIGAAVSAALR